MPLKRSDRWKKGIAQPSLSSSEQKFLRSIDRLLRIGAKVKFGGPFDPQLAEMLWQLHTTGEVPPAGPEEFSDRVRAIMNSLPGWHVIGGSVEVPISDSEMMLPLHELLRRDAKTGLHYLSKWLYANADAATDLFRNRKDYVDLVLWAGLCSLKFTAEQSQNIKTFLMRIIRDVMWKRSRRAEFESPTEFIRERLGMWSQRGSKKDKRESAKTEKEDLMVEDVKDVDPLVDELYYHLIFATLLIDTYFVSRSVMAYLYKATDRHFLDILRKAERRPFAGLRGSKHLPKYAAMARELGETDDEEAVLKKEEIFLSGLIKEQLAEEAIVQLEAVESTIIGELQEFFDRNKQLTERERELAALLANGFTPSECAEKMNVTPARISQLQRSLREKLRHLVEERPRAKT